MKNLKELDQGELLSQIHLLVREERRVTLELIEYLREIERRMLFSELGYGSLFEFTVKHLGLSEGSAQRRISAMRLSRDLPEVKESLASGKISLSNAAKLQTVFRAKKKIGGELKTEAKREILNHISGLTQKECEKKLFEILPEAVKEITKERERVIGENATELRLIVTDRLRGKLQRLKELLSHQSPNGSVTEIFERLADQEIERLEKKKGITPQNTAAVRTEKFRSGLTRTAKIASIPAHVKREVWRRARGRCEYPRCSSRFQLEIDHRTPKALGGRDQFENLRLLCRNHNIFEAQAVLGTEQMGKWVPSLR